LLLLNPAEEIVFRRDDGETTGLLTMTNSVNLNVAYKVCSKTTDWMILEALFDELKTQEFIVLFNQFYRLKLHPQTSTAFVRPLVSLLLARH